MTTASTLKTGTAHASRSLALLLAAAMFCSASFAEKPVWAGGGKGKNKHEQVESHGQGGDDHGKNKGDDHGKNKGHDQQVEVRVGGYFGDQQRSVAQGYYTEQYKAGRCPPGLAKKHNGCMPPGQAKKYMVGQPLPRDVVFYPVPAYVTGRLGTPPAGYKYVRVATDILLIAVGTSMVVDAMQDLGRF